ncbi:MAG TPA: RNA-binding protein [Candidatus Paceibacterota bacterium]|jgi:RNA recognition motif-containing protein|nr:RNA-binding protein [Candidatus Paceibacterota bacterium]
MNNKVFVGSLSFNTDNQGLAAYFAQCGTVTSANVIMNKETGRSKGFGFVEFATDAEAQAAVDKLNNTELDGRQIFCDIARPKAEGEGNRGGFNRGPKRF